MKLKVSKNEIKIIEKSILNDGEYKVNKCEFEFTKEYDSLIKKAVFSSDYKYYKMVVENDECDIPIEVLKKGKIKIGVYAYKIENGEYVRRYSPVPITVEVIDGSYVEKIENISTPSEVEQLEEQLQNKQDILISGTNIKTLNGENLLGEGDIYISASGDMKKEVYDTNNNGIIDNAEKVNNHTVECDVPANAVFTDTVFSGDYNDLSNKPSIPSKTSDLTNDSGYISIYTETDPTVPSHVKGISQSDITNWNNKSTFSGNYEDLTNKPTIPTVPTNVSSFTNDAGYLTSHQDISGKQDTLVSGTNIKTINNESILGSGDISISSGTAYTAGTNIEITSGNVINNKIPYEEETGIIFGSRKSGTSIFGLGVGKNVGVSAWNVVAIGDNTGCYSQYSVVIGAGAKNTSYSSNNSIVIGYNAQVTVKDTIVLGRGAYSNEQNLFQIGSSDSNINKVKIYTSNGNKELATQDYVDTAIATAITSALGGSY